VSATVVPRPAAPSAVRSLAAGREHLPGARIIDVRDAERFAAGHAPGAGRVSLDEFRARRMELPGREEPVLVVHDRPADAMTAAVRLGELGYARVAWLDAPLDSQPDGLASREPPARLWTASPFLERVAPSLPGGRALDLACGAGRASVFLALAGFTVEGWDVDASALELASGFAARAGVDVRFREVDLERGSPPDVDGAFDVIVVLRYLHRPLFPWLERALAPGGALVYETFRRGQERFGHPTKPRHLLEPRELEHAFPSLAVKIHEETPATEPPVLSRIVACKR
jgi:rhodanese-related sulfurtransferase